MENRSLQATGYGSADLEEPTRAQSVRKITEIDLRFMMETLDLEDALAESVHHARHFGEHNIALSLAMILEGLRVRLWEPSSDLISQPLSG